MKKRKVVVLDGTKVSAKDRDFTSGYPVASQEIPFPEKKFGEFELQAEMYSKLRSMGVLVRGEVRCTFGFSGQVRLDLVAYNRKTKKAVAIIECKTSGKEMAKNGRQEQRYSRFKAKTILFNNYSMLHEVASRVKGMTTASEKGMIIPPETLNTEEECVIVETCS